VEVANHSEDDSGDGREGGVGDGVGDCFVAVKYNGCLVRLCH